MNRQDISFNHPFLSFYYSHIVFSVQNCLSFSRRQSVLICNNHPVCRFLSSLWIQLLCRMIWAHLLMMLQSVLVNGFLLLHHLLILLLNLRLLSTSLVIKLTHLILLARIRGGDDILNVRRQSLLPQKLLLLMARLTTWRQSRIVDQN